MKISTEMTLIKRNLTTVCMTGAKNDENVLTTRCRLEYTKLSITYLLLRRKISSSRICC